MKFLIVFACALAAASAGHLVSPVYPGPQHLPVIGANGVPVDTPAVQQATAAHLAHKVEAHARNGDYHQVAPIAPIAAPAFAAPVAAPIAPAHFGSQAYPTTLGVPAVTASGVPLETPEVAAAKTAHFAAHGEALARTSHAYGHYVAKRGVYAYATPAYAYGAYGHHYLAKRGVYAAAPFAYTAPAYHYGAYGHHYLAKRGVYTPFAYSHGYTSAYPYAHYY
ncbi:cuticle protein 18.7-like [Atheta coriaria]|uniref:cuticle protein 18.7-like n=1 Tax=Dalotia coriaria TaxID=877792 RepID=UPI0031F38D85